MRQLLCYTAAAAMVILACTADAATATKKKTHRTKSAVMAHKASPRTHSTTSARKGSKATTKKAATTWRNRQLSPTPERYKEIQQALAAKGYLNPDDANGSWNQASVDGLKKFQMAQNLDPSGKINSLSLIALGLGPKHEGAPVKAEAPQ
jgi:peptidoglycan hydrolase-like protein with peptidoglycan-binding domain